MDGWINGIDGIDGWINGWMYEWMNRMMNDIHTCRWTDELMVK